MSTVSTLRPGEPGYDEAAAVYTRTGSPELIARAEKPQHVAEAIEYAVSRGLALSVRSGGHSGQGWSTNDGGVVVDLRSMADVVVVDPRAGRVRLGAGATWGDVADRLRPEGLALSSGDTRTVGVGGIATSGGIGWMVRKHGLTIDSILSADVVLADGTAVQASETSHPDLFWALRGGGGNFGVVTSVECVAQPVSQVHAGTIRYAPTDLSKFLRAWADVHRTAPEELNSTLYLMRGLEPYPSGVMGAVAYIGDDEAAANAAIVPLLRLDGFSGADIAAKHYADVLAKSSQQPGTRPASTNTLAESFDDRTADAFAEWFENGDEPRLGFIRWLGGAFGRVPSDATAFSQRAAEALIVGRVFGPGDATDEDLAALLAPFDTVHERGIGSYQGFLGITTALDLNRIYPHATLDRLRAVKRRYDPDNRFRLNYNVAP
ncbi:MAG: linked oxidase domain protein [Microbacterium sp.]|nr:linked oxidase domain protein [Microbacterium sp.]